MVVDPKILTIFHLLVILGFSHLDLSLRVVLHQVFQLSAQHRGRHDVWGVGWRFKPLWSKFWENLQTQNVCRNAKMCSHIMMHGQTLVPFVKSGCAVYLWCFLCAAVGSVHFDGLSSPGLHWLVQDVRNQILQLQGVNRKKGWDKEWQWQAWLCDCKATVGVPTPALSGHLCLVACNKYRWR